MGSLDSGFLEARSAAAKEYYEVVRTIIEAGGQIEPNEAESEEGFEAWALDFDLAYLDAYLFVGAEVALHPSQDEHRSVYYREMRERNQNLSNPAILRARHAKLTEEVRLFNDFVARTRGMGECKHPDCGTPILPNTPEVRHMMLDRAKEIDYALRDSLIAPLETFSTQSFKARYEKLKADAAEAFRIVL
ncbi:hypothetical protein B0T16DRAFT_444312, partial [Cercophora newfieldiana]